MTSHRTRNGESPPRRRRWLRCVIFRLGAVMLGLLPFVVAEVAFTVLDWGRPDYSTDPFVGFSGVHPLFIASEDGSRREIAPSRQKFFCPDSFPAVKADDEFRIFCLGGSTVQGRPFAIETSFTTWLELGLTAADPSRKWEVVNCGGISYASYRLVPILEEVLDYQPDLIVLYTGHNEFLEDRTYGHIKDLPGWIAKPCSLLSRTRTCTLLRELGGSQESPQGQPTLKAEVDAMLEYRDGLAQYHRDEKWRRDVIAHFRHNLHRMMHLAREAGVPMILVNPVCNLRDCPPFKNQHRDGLTPDELKRWETLVARAGELQATNMPEAARRLEEAIAIDGQHAGVHYAAAECYDAMGQYDRARAEYIEAKEQDICPLRVLEEMNEAVLEVAGQYDVELLDVRRQFEGLSQGGIPGGYLLVDHVHPSIAGHQLIAESLIGRLVDRGVVKPREDWDQRRERVFRDHLDSLDDLYFSKGQEQLEVLRCWTQGRASKER